MNGSSDEESRDVPAPNEKAPVYEPPRIEIAMSKTDLEREVQYAGNAFSF